MDHNNNEIMLSVTTLPRILGALFYYPPTSEESQQLIPALADLDRLFDWQDKATVKHQAKTLSSIRPEDIGYDFSVLFEGQGHMTAPPWGAVYLQQDHLLMGKSTQHYRDFLAQCGIGVATRMEEPDDQFGLMLLAFACLLEKGADDAAQTLLSDHLLPWAFRYLELLQEAKTEHAFYPTLARVAAEYLASLKTVYRLQVKPATLYF
ncbi:MAG: molecular chaperone [Burkholderiales bacterium]|jgi:TorA maturation chaperone TorD|nr:molecular chaperone [Burkholderiales bacterium]